MIDPKEARQSILENTPAPVRIIKPLAELYGLVAADDIIARHDLPPFDNSAMDGYAVLAADIAGASPERPVKLRLLDELPAGKAAGVAVRAGGAIKIMTGAPIPPGADAVVQIELTAESNGEVSVMAAANAGANIRPSGEEMRAGTTAVPGGTVIDHVIIGLLASLGYAEAPVFKRPVAAIIGTGNELVSIETPLEPGKIRDANSYALTAQAAATGAEARRLGVAGDTKEQVAQLIKTALDVADIVVTSGGISVGEYDFVKEVVNEMDGKLHFWKVKQKPGKPLAFWTLGGKLIFGLPGNPTSSLICFEEYVRPAILKMMGRRNLFRPVVMAALTHDFRTKPGRLYFVGARVTGGDGDYKWAVNGRQGSGMLSSIAGANGIALVPPEAGELKAGDRIEVQLIDRPEDH